MSEKEPVVWQWLNRGAKGTALLYVNDSWIASARQNEYGYFRAHHDDRLDIYEMYGYDLNAKPKRSEISFLSGMVEDLAERYEPPGSAS